MVTSEVGRLRRVLVHTPGQELARVTPDRLQECLIEDLLCPIRAKAEHDLFTAVMMKCGVEVIDVRTHLQRLLANGEATNTLPSVLGEPFYLANQEIVDRLSADEQTDLAITGHHPDLGQALLPLVNLTFTRDSSATIGPKHFITSPRFDVRKRESMIVEAISAYSQDVRGQLQPLLVSSFFDRHVEGGDICVVSDRVVVVGAGERTDRGVVRHLASVLKNYGFETVIRVDFRNPTRDKMHLDTTFTVISETECLIYAPVILNDGGGEAETRVEQLTWVGDRLIVQDHPNLLAALESVGVSLTPIYCGGHDRVTQTREQWWDGTNAFAIAPGQIFLYDRCEATITELQQHGYVPIAAERVLAGETVAPKAVILLPSNELPKARGGPRCLTMPLLRD